jgi:hypothetical protein
MIVAHGPRLIFIKTRKTAGSSVEAALRPLLGPDDICTPIPKLDRQGQAPAGMPPPRNYAHGPLRGRVQALLGKPGKKLLGLDAQRFHAHTPAAEMRRKLGRATWDTYLKVTILRDPYDMLVSLYAHERQMGRIPDALDFAGFVRGDLVRPRNVEIAGIDGRLAADVVLRYERLAADLAALDDRLGLGGALLANFERQRINSGIRSGGALGDWYDAPLRRVVAQRWADEFALFGYDPDGQSARADATAAQNT